MRPLILITNDDGVDSPGLRAAAEAASTIGEVVLVAPKLPQTAMGRSFPRTEDQGIIETQVKGLGHSTTHYHAVSGSPAQAVAHAVLEVCSRRPTLCVSGINNGENLGATNLISGTVGAAIEAAGFGIPSLAVSLGPEDSVLFAKPYCIEEWEVPITVVRRIICSTLRRGLPPRVEFLNVNIPRSATLETEIRITAQSRLNHYICAKPEPRNFSQPTRLPITELIDFGTVEPDSDLHAFCVDRVISVTPMACDMTVRDHEGRAVAIHVDSNSIEGDHSAD
jgi:5'-nucleotidase